MLRKIDSQSIDLLAASQPGRKPVLAKVAITRLRSPQVVPADSDRGKDRKLEGKPARMASEKFNVALNGYRNLRACTATAIVMYKAA